MGERERVCVYVCVCVNECVCVCSSHLGDGSVLVGAAALEVRDGGVGLAAVARAVDVVGLAVAAERGLLLQHAHLRTGARE